MKLGKFYFYKTNRHKPDVHYVIGLDHFGKYGTNWSLTYERHGVNGVTRTFRLTRSVYSNGLDLSDAEAKKFAAEAVAELNA